MRFLILLAIFFAQSVLAAQPMGRLFTTPAERSNLDYLRQTRKNIPVKSEMPTEDIPMAEAAPIVLPDAINMQGYVKRNDGKKGTVWVNNKAMQENSANKDVLVGKVPTDGNRVPIRLHANGKNFSLKAGQMYDPENNRVREARVRAAEDDVGRIGDENTQ